VNHALSKGEIENLHACRFSVKSKDKLNNPGANSKDIPLFRNLFFPCPEEIATFEEMLKGDIYMFLMKAIGLIEKNMSREEFERERNKFKGEFFHFLYRRALSQYNMILDSEGNKEKVEDPVRKAMVARLPSIVFFLDICKCRPGTLSQWGNYYKTMARAIQSIESQIMIECCANLWKQYPDMFLITVHDCIKCLPEDVVKVTEEMKRTFEKYHIFPKFEVKHHKKPSDLHGEDCNNNN
jgi:hypothetical protein